MLVLPVAGAAVHCCYAPPCQALPRTVLFALDTRVPLGAEADGEGLHQLLWQQH